MVRLLVAEHRSVLEPIYSFAEADRLAQSTSGTAKRWLTGYKYRSSDGEVVKLPPVTTGTGRDEGAVSFVDLVETVAISGLKEFGYSLPRIREIVAECQELFGSQYPLAAHVFSTDGNEFFVKQPGDRLVGLLGRKREQAWNEVLDPFLVTLDYQGELASRWWPLGKDVPVVIDPGYGFGLPVIAGTSIRTEIVAERFEHEVEEEIAEDLSVTRDEITRALQFEISRRKVVV